MPDFQIALAAVTAIILFIFGLEHFSRELQKISGERFRHFLGRVTSYPIIGLFIGAIITSIIQSSSATSVIAIGLVNAGVISFKNSLGIIFGANIGTTVTAQLIAFKLTNFAPYFIVLGFVLSLFKTKFSFIGKSLFYFGFVFFSLNLISDTLAPLQNDERLVSFLTTPQGPLLGILMGFVVTAIVQSSSVTTGLVVLLTAQSLLGIENAIAILMGANMGTTVTALFSIINMDRAAKKTALAHALFNIGGVILFLPVVYSRPQWLIWSDDAAIALANFHLMFNLSTSAFFLLIIDPFAKWVEKILGEGSMDFERFETTFMKEEHLSSEVLEFLNENQKKLYEFIQENFNLTTLSLETNYKSVLETTKKRIDYTDYVRKEFQSYFSHLISHSSDDSEIQKYIHVMNHYEYLFQLHDSVKDLLGIKENMDGNFIELKSDMILYLRELTSHLLTFFTVTRETIEKKKSVEEFKKDAHLIQEEINRFHKHLLRLIGQEERSDAGSLYHMVSSSQRLKDKLMNYQRLNR
jgi:phosphate:Na+ symporter